MCVLLIDIPGVFGMPSSGGDAGGAAASAVATSAVVASATHHVAAGLFQGALMGVLAKVAVGMATLHIPLTTRPCQWR